MDVRRTAFDFLDFQRRFREEENVRWKVGDFGNYFFPTSLNGVRTDTRALRHLSLLKQIYQCSFY